MGPRQADDAVEAGLAAEEAGDLGFLAAHDVGGLVLASARVGCGRRGGVADLGRAKAADVGGQGTAA